MWMLLSIEFSTSRRIYRKGAPFYNAFAAVKCRGSPKFLEAGLIGIGAAVARGPLPHHRAYGSVHGGSSRLR